MPARLNPLPAKLSLTRRERQIMEIVYSRKRATAAEVHSALANAPSLTAVRTWLRILEEKGQLKHEKDGARFVYLPAVPWRDVQRSAVKHLLRGLFAGSPTALVATLMDVTGSTLSDNERNELRALLRKSAKNGK